MPCLANICIQDHISKLKDFNKIVLSNYNLVDVNWAKTKTF